MYFTLLVTVCPPKFSKANRVRWSKDKIVNYYIYSDRDYERKYLIFKNNINVQERLNVSIIKRYYSGMQIEILVN